MLILSNMKYTIRIAIVIFASIPFLAYAQLPSLIVCDPVQTSPGGATGDCTFSSIIGLANTVIKFLIILGTSVFSIMFMWAGFTYLTANGNTGKISKAHTYFLDAIIGFVIMLAAWLFVDFILTALVKGVNPNQYKLLGK